MANSKHRPPASGNRHRRAEDPGEGKGPEELSPAEVARLIRELKRLQEEERLHKEELERLAEANRQLREENESLQALFRAAPLAMGVFDAEGRLVQVNPASERIFGWSREEMQGRLPPSIPPENPRESLETLRRLLQGESFVGAEIRQRRKDGALIDLSFSAAPLYDAQGRLRGFVGLAEDITERKRAQAALLRITEEWERTFDAVPDGIAILDQEHRIIRLNRAMAALLGRVPEEVLGQPCYKTIHGQDEVPTFCPHARLLATGKEQFAEVQEFGRIFEVSVSPIFDSYGQVRGSVHVARDITGRKLAEEALRLSNQRLDLLAETASRLLATDSPQKVVDSLCQKVMAFLDCDVFFNYLLYEDNERLHLNAYAGIPEEEARRIEWLDCEVAVCGCVARDKCRIVVEDVQANLDPRTEWVRSYGIKAYACHPLLVQDRLFGTLSFGTRKRSRFTPDELSLMQAVADHVAIALYRMEAEQTLRENREDLNRAQAVAHVGSWRLDVRRNRLTWSEENHRIFGIPPGTPMTYETFLAAVHPEDREYVDRKWKAALQGEPYDIEHRIVVNGKVKWVREQAELEFDQEGRLRGGFGITQDITGRKKMEEILKEAHARTTAILNSISDSFFTLDRNLVVTYYNRAAEKTLGRKAEEVLGKKLFDVFPETRGSIFAAKYTEALRTGQPLAFETYFDVPPFENWYDVRVYPFGEGLSVFFQVTTERKRAEEALRRAKEELELRVEERTAELRLSNESLLREIEERQQAEEALAVERQRLMAVLDRIPAYVALIAPDYTLPVVNREFVQRFGEPGHRRCFEFLFGRKEPCPDCKALKVFQTKAPEIWEWTGPDGRTYQIYDYPFTDVDGSPLVLELGVDITDRKQAEEALRKSEENLHLLATRLLEVQESERRRFSLELHDELGQSLLLLKFKLSAIKAGLAGAAAEIRGECREAQQYLDELVEKVRRLSRDLSPSPLEELGLTSALKYVFHECCKHYKISRYSIKIDDIDGCFGSARQVNIYRIFQEALTNIGKHAEADKISVTVKRQSRRATFTITDNGKGFQVSEVLSRPAGKKGLGLAAINERLRMMAGDLKIISRKGAGTKLVFTVPFGQE